MLKLQSVVNRQDLTATAKLNANSKLMCKWPLELTKLSPQGWIEVRAKSYVCGHISSWRGHKNTLNIHILVLELI